MAIAFKQSRSSDTSGTSVTLAFTSNVTAGSLLVVAVRTGATGRTVTVSDNVNAGNYTQAVSQDQTTDGHNDTIHYKENVAAGATTVTVAIGSPAKTIRFGIHEYSGAATSGSLDKTSGGQGSGTALSATSVTPAQDNELVFSLGSSSVVDTFTKGTNFTARENTFGASGKAASEDWIQTTATATTGNWTINQTDNWAVAQATFKVPGAAAGSVVTPRSLTLLGVGS